MLVSLNWLKEFVELDNVENDEIIERMTMSGTKVEGIEELGERVSGVVVGKIISITRHPDADKLVVTKVDVGNKTLQIVTGANNINEGDYIPVALIGAKLNDTKIKKSKLRGIESHGMMCSAEELGANTSLLPKEDTNGIYILKEQYPLGIDVKPILGLDDKIIEFELTANRSDCMCIIGISREVSATFNKHLVLPVIEVNEQKEKIDDYLNVEIEDDVLCPRYVARMMDIKKIEPSPYWMQKKLINSGVRPINNIVDVTNYVMLEMGQPLHAFDYKKLQSKDILVRTAKNNEEIITLDSVKRELDENMLVITNGTVPVGIAGVMGGENSEIDNNTDIIVLESACFDKKSIRHTSKKLGLRSEASSRYEKGVDSDLAGLAIERAAQLLEELNAAEVLNGKIDVYKNKKNKKRLSVSINWINEFIGINISGDEMKEYLERLFVEVEIDGENLEVIIPTFRPDLVIKEDIAEEVARLFGYNNIPNTIMRGATSQGRRNNKHILTNKIKSLLCGKGFYEVLTYSFTSKNRLEALNLDKDNPLSKGIKLINPLGEENSLMRPTLIPGMLQVISHNYNRNENEGLFFETAVVYNSIADLGEKLPNEEKKISIGVYGEKDFFDMKGYIEQVVEKAGINCKLEYLRSELSMFHPERSAKIIMNNEEVGVFGEVHPIVVENYDLPERTYICELNLEKIYNYSDTHISFTELPKYPGISRDIALLVEKNITCKDIEDIIKENSEGLLEDIKLFDVYQGKQIKNGYKSIAYSLIFRAKDRTLTDKEINHIFNKIINEAKNKLDAQLR
ncbi:MAG: phenylalanine--tRNA ligase subunit beta [Eubacteriaceae bacterium]